MASISSLGIGSGLDIAGLVNQLVSAEGAPKQARLDRRETELTTKLSAMGAVKGVLASFQSSLATVRNSFALSTISATSSDTDLFGASASRSAAAGTYSIEINQLAQAHKIKVSAANAVSSTTETIGTGTLTFEFVDPDNGYAVDSSKTATVDITGGSLTEIRDSINNAGIGVQASIVYNGSDYQLVMTSETGAANTMKVTVADDDGNHTDATGLSIFHFDPQDLAGSQLEQGQVAQDAEILVDSITITSDSNTITNAIDGVTLSLKDVTTSAETLTISSNTSTVKNAVQSFVDAYNTVLQTLDQMTFYDTETKQKGLFLGDSMLRNIESQLRNTLVTTTGNQSEAYNALATIGITTKDDGTLVFDSSKLSSALADDPNAVVRLLGGGVKDLSSADQSNLRFHYVPEGMPEGKFLVDVTAAATRGTYTGAAGFTLNDGDTFGPSDTLDIAVDGGGFVTVDLDGIAYNIVTTADAAREQLAADIQNAINAELSANGRAGRVSMTYDTANAKFEIASTEYGDVSIVNITNVAANITTRLGVSASGGAISGTDVEGRIGGLTASGTGRHLTATGAYSGLQVQYLGTNSSYQVRAEAVDGVMDKFFNLVDSLLASDGIVNSRNASFQDQIDDISVEREKLQRRLEDLEFRYLKQFSAMDALVAQLNATGDYLTNQIKQLQGLNSN